MFILVFEKFSERCSDALRTRSREGTKHKQV